MNKPMLRKWFEKGLANGFRTGAEFGFKAAEKGWNLEKTRLEAEKIIDKSSSEPRDAIALGGYGADAED